MSNNTISSPKQTKKNWLSITSHKLRSVLQLSILAGFGLSASACIIRLPSKGLPLAKSSRFVHSTKPVQAAMVERVSFVGVVEPRKLLSLHFLVPGRIERCSVSEGQAVREGQELCRLDMSAVSLEVARALNSVKAAKKLIETNLADKQKALFEAGVIGQSEFEQVRLQSEGAKAQYADAVSVHDIALKKQKEHIISAPWDGVVTKILAKAGMPTSPEFPALVLSDERSMQIGVDLHASYFANISIGIKGLISTISSQALPSPIPLKVAEKAITIAPETQSFRVILRPERVTDEKMLTPGILASGEIILRTRDNVLKIPQKSLVSWEHFGNSTVYVIENGVLVLKDIRTGILDEGFIEVKEGLSQDSEVVVELASDLVAGMRVRSE